MNAGSLLSPKQVNRVSSHPSGTVRNKNDIAARRIFVTSFLFWCSVLVVVVIALHCPAVRTVEKDTCRSTSHGALSPRYLSWFSIFNIPEATGFLDVFLTTPVGDVRLFGPRSSKCGLAPSVTWSEAKCSLGVRVWAYGARASKLPSCGRLLTRPLSSPHSVSRARPKSS